MLDDLFQYNHLVTQSSNINICLHVCLVAKSIEIELLGDQI